VVEGNKLCLLERPEFSKIFIFNYEFFINYFTACTQYTEKNGFVTATKLGTTDEFFVRFVDRTEHFVVVTKYFCYPYFNK